MHIFIAGLHRSGTSLLHRILCDHLDISGFSNTGVPEDEGQHLQSIYPAARVHGGPGKFAFHPAAHLDETSVLLTSRNRQNLLKEWSLYWDMQKSYLIEKSPPNLLKMRFLQAMFPQSRFIVLLRHPLTVGYATQKWAHTDIRELVEHWVIAHQIMVEDLPYIEHYILLRYEDLVQQPVSAIQHLCRFIGISEFTHRQIIESTASDGYFKRWGQETEQNPMLKRRVALLEALPHHFGYSFSPPYVEAYHWQGHY